jgi:hypothetical protein
MAVAVVLATALVFLGASGALRFAECVANALLFGSERLLLQSCFALAHIFVVAHDQVVLGVFGARRETLAAQVTVATAARAGGVEHSTELQRSRTRRATRAATVGEASGFVVTRIEVAPALLIHQLHRQRNLATIGVDAEHFHKNALSRRDNFRRLFDAPVSHLRDVHETVLAEPVHGNECSKRLNRMHNSTQHRVHRRRWTSVASRAMTVASTLLVTTR